MIHNLLLCIWALKVLYCLKEIQLSDRFRLWRKSVHLYLSFLAFTDSTRPRQQLGRAMVAAILSAIYDYDTDWRTAAAPDASIFARLLQRWVDDDETKRIAYDLFSADLRKQLSTHGLERGSVALTFYDRIIRSNWMGEYSPEEINWFGRQLQIIDDVLDLTSDELLNHTNCLLTPEKLSYLEEVKEFLKSGFWQQLTDRSPIYRMLECKCQQILNGIEDKTPSWKELYGACRPLAGIYAAVFTLIGFRYVSAPFPLTALTAFSFLGITSTIMLFNDLVDRKHDMSKGKHLAAKHTWRLSQFLLALSALTIGTIGGIAIYSTTVALACCGILAIGFMYSWLRRLYILQNLIVGACSASPILCGMLYSQEILLKPMLLFVTVISIIYIREILKDLEDISYDPGYKATIPVKLGYHQTVFVLTGLCFLPALLLAIYPSPLTRIPAYCFGFLEAIIGLMMYHPKLHVTAKTCIDVAGLCLLVVLFIAP